MRPSPESRSTPEDIESQGHASRRSFLQRSAAATALAVPGIILANSSRAQAAGNENILPSLYPGWNKKNFQDILQHENAHVAYLEEALGPLKRPRPNFNVDVITQPTAMQFARTSRQLENTGTGAYLGALPDLSTHTLASQAGSIAQIEARHSGFLNTLLNQHINSNIVNEAPSREIPLTQAEVLRGAAPFIKDLNGGPPIGFQTNVRTPANDIAILNYALALEYLEQYFYQVNVPRFLHVM